MLRIEAFGELTVVRDDRRVAVAPPEAPHLRGVLTLLALHGAAGVSRERVAALLQPPQVDDPESWWTSVVRGLRDWLGDAHLEVASDHLALGAGVASSDVLEFTEALAAGDLERAVQLHHGRLVEGLHHRDAPAFERFLQLQREALASDAASALERLAEEASRRGEPLTAVRWWRQLAMQYPLNHRIAASLMEALVAAGDREGALRHARFLEALADERLALPGDEQVLAMAQALRGDDKGTASAVEAPGTTDRPVPDPFERFRVAVADRYRIEGEVGRGGHGAVLRAVDLRHDRPVAIKVLHPELAPALGGTRFVREIRTVAALHHPNILPLFDSGSAGGTLYFVMPLVRGISLRERLQRDGALPLREAVAIARQVAAALGAAHRQGIVHRDIKPENILLVGQSALLADFGIAHAVDAQGDCSLTAPGVVVGTPAYMSPEQGAPGEELDGRSDLYSLGCVLYEMLAGTPPFAGERTLAILAGHATATVPTLSRMRPELDARVKAVVRRALEKRPADRYASAEAFEAALDALLVTPDTPPARARRGVGTIALVVAALTVLASALLLPLGRSASPAAVPRPSSPAAAASSDPARPSPPPGAPQS